MDKYKKQTYGDGFLDQKKVFHQLMEAHYIITKNTHYIESVVRWVGIVGPLGSFWGQNAGKKNQKC